MDQFRSELEQTLAQAIQGNSQEIKSATEKLKKGFYTQPQVIPALVEILQSHQNPSLRQLAGVELNKNIWRFWVDNEEEDTEYATLDDSTKEPLRASLLESTQKEPNELVRHTSAQVICAIASTDLDEGKWPGLFPAVVSFSQSSNAADREISAFILNRLLEDMGDAVQSTRQDIMNLLAALLRDPESLAVRIAAVVALGSLFLVLEEGDFAQYEQLVPSILEVLSQAIAADDDKGATDIFNALNELVVSEVCPLNKYMSDILQHMIQDYGINQNLSDDYRNGALNFVLNVARWRYKKLQALNYGPVLTKACLEIMSQPADQDDNDVDDEDSFEDTPFNISTRIIGYLAEYLPPTQVVGPLIDLMPSLIRSGNPYQAHAAFTALVYSVDGAPDFIYRRFEVIFPLLVEGLQNEADFVKVSALSALGRVALQLPELIGAEHAVLLPLVFNTMDNAKSLAIARQSCMALNFILESLDRQVITEKYLDAIVPKLLSLVSQIDDNQLKGSVVRCVGSAAVAAGRHFLPYFQQTVGVIEKYIGIPQKDVPLDKSVAKLWGMALDSLGTLCSAVGAEHFRPVLAASMDASLAYLDSDVPELKEAALIFLSVVVKAFKDDFTPYLERTLLSLYAVCQQTEFDISEDIDYEGAIVGMDEGALEDAIKVNNAVCFEKEYACDSLGDIISNVSTQTLQPYLEQILDILESCADNMLGDVRSTAIDGLWRLFTIYYLQEHPETPEGWTPEFPYSGPLSDFNRELGNKIRGITLEKLANENEVGSVGAIFSYMTVAIFKCGPWVLGSQEEFAALLEQINAVLNKEHLCQQDEGLDGEVDATGDISEGDEDLIDSATGLLGGIAHASGPGFVQLFQPLAEVLRKYVTSKHAGERTTGVAMFAELYQYLKDGLAQWDSAIMEIFLNALADKKLAVRATGAWGAGLICLYSANTELVRKSYPLILTHLQKLLKKVDRAEKKRTEADEEELHNDYNSLANACGCVARMALRFPDLVPLDQVVPVLLQRLPLQAGFDENEEIYNLLKKLIAENNSAIQAQSNEFIRVIVEVVKQQAEITAKNADRSVGEPEATGPLDNANAKSYVKDIVGFLVSNNPSLAEQNPILKTL